MLAAVPKLPELAGKRVEYERRIVMGMTWQSAFDLSVPLAQQRRCQHEYHRTFTNPPHLLCLIQIGQPKINISKSAREHPVLTMARERSREREAPPPRDYSGNSSSYGGGSGGADEITGKLFVRGLSFDVSELVAG